MSTSSLVHVRFPNGEEANFQGPLCVPEILEYAQPRMTCVDFYILHHGKKLPATAAVANGNVDIIPRLPGGKGGFGSMLRAIGAQIEKTTNREACRDLSGRRLRDINEEKRLKTWITQQADRERDAAERKRKRLERLVADPKLEFKDPKYEAARSEMTEKVSDAVEQGFKAAASGSSSQVGSKRSASATSTSVVPPKKKKTCMWLDMDEEELSSSLDTDDSEDEQASASPSDTKKTTVSEVEAQTSTSLEATKKVELDKSEETIANRNVLASDIIESDTK